MLYLETENCKARMQPDRSETLDIINLKVN